MHICTVTPEYPPQIGGVGYYAFNLCNKLVEKGHRVTVITRGSWERWRHEYVKGVSVYRIRFLPLYPFHVQLHGIFANKFLKWNEPNFDVVHIHHPLSPLIQTLLPSVVTVHGLMKSEIMRPCSLRSLTYKIFSQFIAPLELKTLANATLLTSDSYAAAREMKAYYGFHANTIEVIGNGVDDEFFIPAKSNEDNSCVLYSGRLVYRKGVTDLVESAKYVCREHPSAFFVFAGSGPLRNHLTKLINRMGVSKKIFLIGCVNRESLLEHYQNAAVSVLPSYYESFPCTLLESMACGLPVVATPVGDMPKIVKNWKTGFLVPPRDPKALGEAILRILKDKALRKKMGEASRKDVETSYSWDVVSEKVLDCYRFVMDQS